VIINPQTGIVEGMIDFTGLLKEEDMTERTDVLNGIAYDAEGKRIFVTGKLWNKLFEVEINK
jgi:glutamine cyclotransferase